MVWLPEGENCDEDSLCSFVSTEYTNVTDGQTDGHRIAGCAYV